MDVSRVNYGRMSPTPHGAHVFPSHSTSTGLRPMIRYRRALYSTAQYRVDLHRSAPIRHPPGLGSTKYCPVVPFWLPVSSSPYHHLHLPRSSASLKNKKIIRHPINPILSFSCPMSNAQRCPWHGRRWVHDHDEAVGHASHAT